MERFELHSSPFGGFVLSPNLTGSWVRMSDHEQVVDEWKRLAEEARDNALNAEAEATRLRAELAAKSKEVQELHSGIAKALDEIEDAGPKALKYAAQELRTAMGEGNGR